MMRSNLDLLGLYLFDDSLFDNINIPSGIDKDILIDNLLAESAELELLYPDFDYMKNIIGIWSSKQLRVWNELYDTLNYDYNPLYNKDAYFDLLETRDLKGTEDTTTNTDNVNAGTQVETQNLQSADNTTTTEYVYGFNSDTDSPSSKAVSDETIKNTGTDSFVNESKQDLDTVIDRDTTDTGTIKHFNHEYGNIGVTSTQSLIDEQREIVQFNLYDYIIEDFIKRFCLLKY